MSRIGRAPITVPSGVTIDVDEQNVITVKGPKGTLERKLNPQISVEIENGVINVKRPDDAIDGRYAWLPADFRDGRLEIAWRDTFPPAAENERGGI